MSLAKRSSMYEGRYELGDRRSAIGTRGLLRSVSLCRDGTGGCACGLSEITPGGEESEPAAGGRVGAAAEPDDSAFPGIEEGAWGEGADDEDFGVAGFVEDGDAEVFEGATDDVVVLAWVDD